MIDPQQSGQRWELSQRINLGVLVNSIEGTRVRFAPFAGRVLGAFVSSIRWIRARLEPLVGRLRTAQLSRVARVRIDVVGKIKAAAMWTFVTIELGLLIALIVGAFLIYASTTKSALIS